MAKHGKTGVSSDTPKNILFGAGTIHKNLKYTGSTWNFEDSIIGATSGGSTFNITPEILALELDGALVKFKEGEVKTGEVANMEINFAELGKDIIKSMTLGKEGTSSDSTFDVIESKPNISTGDYFDNIAFVGKTLEGKDVIAIMENALCTSGLSNSNANKTAAVNTATFECHATIDSDLDTLPWHIYWPKPTA